MTDRLHSCKRSPNGRHAFSVDAVPWADQTAPIWVDFGGARVREACRYCGQQRDQPAQSVHVEAFWKDLGRPDDHIGAVGE